MTGRVLVTGGAGFIGTHLLPRLASAAALTVFDNLHPQVHGEGASPPKLPPGARLVLGDIRDPSAVADVIAEACPDTVIHLAAETGTGQSFDEAGRYCDVNVTGTAHLVEAIRRLPVAPERRRLLLASSRAIYGEGSHATPDGRVVVPPPRRPSDMAAGRFEAFDGDAVIDPLPTREDAPPTPASIYASTKLMQEYVVRQALAGTEVDVVILRFQNVYGPGQSLRNPYTGVLSIFCEQILRGRILNIFEDGRITRDFVFVEDVADAIVAGLEHPQAAGLVCNVGSGVGATIEDVARTLLRLLDAPVDALRVSGDFRAGDVRHAVADISVARERLGWTPAVALEEGLRRLAAAVRAEVRAPVD